MCSWSPSLVVVHRRSVPFWRHLWPAVLCLAPLLSAAPPFPMHYATGPSPNDVAAGDFDNDGLVDLAIACHSTSSPEVSILFGAGEGRFVTSAVPIEWPKGGPYTVAVADFDGDGNLDCAVASGNRQATSVVEEEAVRVFFGDGRGRFPRASAFFNLPGRKPLPPAKEPRLFVCDLNRDGRPDLICLAYEFSAPDPVMTLVNEGNGNFKRLESAIPDSGLILGAAAADFDGDGNIDLAVLRSGDKVQIALGDGKGGFSIRTPLVDTGGVGGAWIVAADLDGDKRQDLVIALRNSNRLAVRFGFGDGTFAATPLFLDTPPGPSWLAVGDLTGDGLKDIFASASSAPIGQHGAIFTGLGNRRFGTAGTYALHEPFAGGLACDLNGDGVDDLVGLLSNKGQAFIGLGGLPHGISGERCYDLGAGHRIDATAVGDLNGDGRPEIVIADGGAREIVILSARADGSLREEAAWPMAEGAGIRDLACADVNGDGAADVLLACYGRGVEVYHGDGQNGLEYAGTLGESLGAQGVAAGRLNDDAFPDIVVAGRRTPVSSSSGVYVFLGRADHGFEPYAAYEGLPSFAASRNLKIIDLDGDSRLDCLVDVGGERPLAVFYGNGNGTLQAARYLPRLLLGATAEGDGLAAADFNGDGIIDAAKTDRQLGRVYVWLGRGGRAFHDPFAITAGHLPKGLAAADLDGDGVVDLACSVHDPVPGQSVNWGITVLWNRGDGTFAEVETAFTYRYSSLDDVHAVDLDRNGLPELVGVSTSPYLFTLLNPGKVSPGTVIERVEPWAGPLAGGTVVEIHGRNFRPGLAVRFGQAPAPDVRFVGARCLRATTPAVACPGGCYVDVRAGDAVLARGFRYVADRREITGANPNWAPIEGGAEVVVKGNGFVPGPGLAVYLGVYKAAVLNATATSITVRTPAAKAGNTGTVDIHVWDSAGKLRLKDGFFLGRRMQNPVQNVNVTWNADGSCDLEWDTAGSYPSLEVVTSDGEVHVLPGESTMVHLDPEQAASAGEVTIKANGDPDAGIDGGVTTVDIGAETYCSNDAWVGGSAGRPGTGVKKLAAGCEFGGLIEFPSSIDGSPVRYLVVRLLLSRRGAFPEGAELQLLIRSRKEFESDDAGRYTLKKLRWQPVSFPAEAGRPEWITTTVVVDPEAEGLKQNEPGFGQMSLTGDGNMHRYFFTLYLDAPEDSSAAVFLHFDDSPAYLNPRLYDGDVIHELGETCKRCWECEIVELFELAEITAPNPMIRVTPLTERDGKIALNEITWVETGLPSFQTLDFNQAKEGASRGAGGSPVMQAIEGMRSFLFTVSPKAGSAPVAEYRWDFGDGGSAISSGTTVAHMYVRSALYRVTVTARGANCDEARLRSRAMLLNVRTPGSATDILEVDQIYNEFGLTNPNVFVGPDAAKARRQVDEETPYPHQAVTPFKLEYYTYVRPGWQGLWDYPDEPRLPVYYQFGYKNHPPESWPWVPAEPVDMTREEAMTRPCWWRGEIDFSLLPAVDGIEAGLPVEVWCFAWGGLFLAEHDIARATAWRVPLPWRDEWPLAEALESKISVDSKTRSYAFHLRLPNGFTPRVPGWPSGLGIVEWDKPIGPYRLCVGSACLPELKLDNRVKAALTADIPFSMTEKYHMRRSAVGAEVLVQFLNKKLIDKNFRLQGVECLHAGDRGSHLCFRACKPNVFGGNMTIFKKTVPIAQAWFITITWGMRIGMSYGLDLGAELALNTERDLAPKAYAAVCPHIEPSIETWLDADIAFLVGAGVSATAEARLGVPIELQVDSLPLLDGGGGLMDCFGLDADLCWRFYLWVSFYGKVCGIRVCKFGTVTLLNASGCLTPPCDLCRWCWVDPDDCGLSSGAAADRPAFAFKGPDEDPDPEEVLPAVCGDDWYALTVWVQDTDPDPARAAPQLFWSLREGDGEPSAPAAIWPDAAGRMPSDPVLAWVPGANPGEPGQAVLVWSENQLPLVQFNQAFMQDGDLDVNEYAAFQTMQDVYLAVWTPGSGWSRPLRLSDHDHAHKADAFPQVCACGYGARVAVAWVRCTQEDSTDPRASAVAACVVQVAPLAAVAPEPQLIGAGDGALKHMVRLARRPVGEGTAAILSFIKDADADLTTVFDRTIEIWECGPGDQAFTFQRSCSAPGANEAVPADNSEQVTIIAVGMDCLDSRGINRFDVVDEGLILKRVNAGLILGREGEVLHDLWGLLVRGTDGGPVDAAGRLYGKNLKAFVGPDGSLLLGMIYHGAGAVRDGDGELAVARIPAAGGPATVTLVTDNQLVEESMDFFVPTGLMVGPNIKNIEVVGVSRPGVIQKKGRGERAGLRRLRITARPDLHVALSIAPPHGKPGQEVVITAQVVNRGAAPASVEGLVLELARDGAVDAPRDLWEVLHAEALGGAVLEPDAWVGFEQRVRLRTGADRFRAAIGVAPGEAVVENNVVEETVGLWRPAQVRCAQVESGRRDVLISWEAQTEGIEIAIVRDGVPVAVVPAGASEYLDCDVLPGAHLWTLTARDQGSRSLPAECRAEVVGLRCTMELGSAAARIGDAAGVQVPLRARLARDLQIRGFAAGIRHDPALVAFLGAATAGTAFEGAVLEVEREADGVNVRATLPEGAESSWPEGEEIVLCNLRYRAAPDISADALGYRAELALASDVGGASFPVSFMAPSGAWEAAAVENGAIALVAFAEPPPPLFRRGDANDSGRVDIADAIFVLGYLFAEAPAPVCPDAADANDDGRLDIADAVRILAYLFAGASLPPPGAQACGVDPTEDTLPACASRACAAP